MRCQIEVNAQALRHNYQVFQKLSAPAVAMPVVKANAYGHGLAKVYQILKDQACPWLAVNYPEEGSDLRSLAYQGRILVVGPVAPSKLALCAAKNLDIIIGDFTLLGHWQQLKAKPTAHIKIDTGMSRQGFLPSDLERLIPVLTPYQTEIYGISSHFADVEDVLDHEYALCQLERFQKACATFKQAGFKLLPHIASSASTLLLAQSLFAMTRIGISLYGLWPSSKTRLSYLQAHPSLAQLQPVLTWSTEVALTKPVREGDYIGYGCTFRALKDMTIAVLPVGYFEGYPRLASGRGSYVLIRGKRCPIVGRICMNMMMVDVSHAPSIQPADRVTLIGQDGIEIIRADDLASWADTIHYELLACLNPSIPRVVIDGA